MYTQNDAITILNLLQDLVGQMVESLFFRLFILGIISVNAVLIALQTMELVRIKWSLVEDRKSSAMKIEPYEIGLLWGIRWNKCAIY